jgi:hypothetical protein
MGHFRPHLRVDGDGKQTADWGLIVDCSFDGLCWLMAGSLARIVRGDGLRSAMGDVRHSRYCFY